MTEMRQNALPILEQAGVDLVLTGHSHSYERSFLIDGHYGLSGTFTSSMKKDGGSGREDGTGTYKKPTDGLGPHEGAVYSVAGSSGQTSGGALNHAAMYISLNSLSTNGKSFTQIATVGASVTSYGNTGLKSNKKYWYRVRAYNATGNSTYSNVASAATPRR